MYSSFLNFAKLQIRPFYISVTIPFLIDVNFLICIQHRCFPYNFIIVCFISGVVCVFQPGSAARWKFRDEYNDITVNWIYVKTQCKVGVVSGQFLFELTFVRLGPYKSLQVSFKP